MSLVNYKKLFLNSLNNISNRLDKIKTSTFVILFVLFHIIYNFKDVKQGFKDGWNETTKEEVIRKRN